MIVELHHVQLAMPKGAEDEARHFYTGILGLPEVAKPAALKGRGGVWFETGPIRVHLGIEDPFFAARKAHPAFRVRSLDETAARLTDHGIDMTPGEDLPGLRRLYIADPFGNRIELLETVGPET